jgi:hypothetical protein
VYIRIISEVDMNKLKKDGQETFRLYGTATGCRRMGAGEIVKATHLDLEITKDGPVLDGIPVFILFAIDNNEIIYFTEDEFDGDIPDKVKNLMTVCK